MEVCLSPTSPSFDHKLAGSVTVVNSLGSRFDVSFSESDTVDSLRKRISRQLKISPDSFTIVSAGQTLEHGFLREYGIEAGSVLTIQPRLLSGRSQHGPNGGQISHRLSASDLLQALTHCDQNVELNVNVGDKIYSVSVDPRKLAEELVGADAAKKNLPGVSLADGAKNQPQADTPQVQVVARNTDNDADDDDEASSPRKLYRDDDLEREYRKAIALRLDQLKEEQRVAKAKAAETKKLSAKLDQVRANLKRKKLGHHSAKSAAGPAAKSATTAAQPPAKPTTFGGLKKGFLL